MADAVRYAEGTAQTRMAALETAVTGAAKAVGSKAGKLWLAQRAAEEDRHKDLSELIRVSFRDALARRKVDNQLQAIALAVEERLQPLCEQELRGLTAADKAAVLAEVTETLERADLGDGALLGADADPAILAGRVRRQTAAGKNLAFELGEGGARLFGVLLEECCDALLRIVMELPQFGPRAAGEVLSRLTGIADQVASVLAQMPERSLDAPEGTDDDEEFARRYGDHIGRVLDFVELFGVRVRRYRPQTPLSVAYISLSVSADGRRRRGASEGADRRLGHLPLSGEGWEDGERAATATVRAENALGERHRTLIRGEAGSGKSTLLRWLAITAVRGGFGSDLAEWNGCTPFLVKLRSHADGDLPRPEQFLTGTADALAGLMPKGWVHRRLASGRALLLVDGVDELSPSQRRKVPGWLRDLLAAYPQVRVVVTSRPAAASARWLAGEGFSVAHLEPMSPADLGELIRQWHLAMAESPHLPCPVEELQAYEGALKARLESAPHLRTLAQTPLLAAMLCALNLDHATRLPRDRMGLYAATLEMLLDKRDGDRDIPAFKELDMDFAQKSRVLQGLAWRLSVSNRSELPTQVVRRDIESRLAAMPRAEGAPDLVADYLLQRSGVLREPVEGRVDFVHRTVQEYLTAQQAVFDHEIEYLVERAHQPSWRETFVMAIGHANGPQTGELLGGILERAEREPRRARYLKLLVAASLETAATVPVELRERIDACVADLVPPRDMATARSLATAGEVVLDHLPESVEELTEAQAVATVHAAALINGPRALDVLAGYRLDGRAEVQRELQRVWGYFRPDEYARRVLSDAPLPSGEISVSNKNQLLAINHIREMDSLRCQFELKTLDLFSKITPPPRIQLHRENVLDFSPLIRHGKIIKELYATLGKPTDLSPLTKLTKLNCLNINLPGQRDINFVSQLPQLDTLILRDLEEVTDFSPVSVQRSIRTLWLTRCPQLTDLAILPSLGNVDDLGLNGSRLTCTLNEVAQKAPRLSSLNLVDCPWVEDLSPLSGLRLTYFYLGSADVDISPLASQQSLTHIHLNKMDINDLSPLGKLKNLQVVNLTSCSGPIDLSPLAHLRKLRIISLKESSEIDLAPLAHLRNLHVDVHMNQKIKNRRAFRGNIKKVPR